MTWAQLSGAAPLMHFFTTGIIQWNAAAQAMMGNPLAVEMFHDPDLERLGFRGVSWHAPLLVRLDEDLLYTIDAAAHLENAGVSFDRKWDTTPQEPEGLSPPDPPTAPDMRGIVWIQLE